MMIEVMTVRILVLLVGRQLQVQTPQAACRHLNRMVLQMSPTLPSTLTPKPKAIT